MRIEKAMTIGEVSEASGLPVKTVRYYTDIGLIAPERSDNGYRQFGEKDLHRLRFVARARALGFTVKDCRALLDLYGDEHRASAEVRTIAQRHLSKIEQKIADLQAMEQTLAHLVSCCAGDSRPDCPILEELAPTGKHS